MQQIEVGRWLFWCGVLVLGAILALTILISPQPDLKISPFGTGLNLVVTLIWADMFLFLFSSVAPRTEARTDAPGGTNSSPADGR